MAAINYGTWRSDKPKENGFTQEFISCDFDLVKEKANMDDLLMPEPYPGVSTIYHALMRRANDQRMGARQYLGTREGTVYKWMTYKEVADEAKQFAAGVESLGMVPEVDAEGKKWKFLGVQSKNRKEWNITHLSNMFHGVTTVGLYDTLGEAASRYIINQTEMTTVATTPDIIKKIIGWKKDD